MIRGFFFLKQKRFVFSSIHIENSLVIQAGLLGKSSSSVCAVLLRALAAPLKELPVTKERVQLVVPDCCIIMIGKKVWKTSSVAN